MTLAEWNAMPAARAAESLGVVCGVRRWIERMVAGRPFHAVRELSLAADEAWATLGPDDWREAFRHHPRIGDPLHEPGFNRGTAAFASDEQARVAEADGATRAALARANREYEKRFGFIFLTCATGKTADELLAEARARLANDPARELEIAADEQRKILQIRLRKVFATHEGIPA